MKSTQETMRGIATNWVALALSFVVTFFLSPFVVHHLGNTAYGVWTLVVSVTSYMRLLDLGLRGAVTRFVARDQAKGNHEGASQMVSAALWLRQWIGLLILVLSIILAAGINHFFNVPHEMRTAASQAIIVSGLTVVATLLSGVFAGVLAAMHRFDAISGVSVLQIIMRALGVVWLLRSGHGILALAVLELVIAVVPNLLLVWNCFRIYPELRVSLRFPRQNALREIWTHTSYIIVIHICGQIIYYTDNIVVGSCISVAAVTLFAIGGSIAEYLRQILGSITPTFMPLASRFDATGDRDQLRRLLIQGTRLALLAVLPVQMALLIRGRSFIGLWMGQQYGQVSGVVLQILLVGQIFAAANSTGHNIVLGLGKFGKAAKWGIAEALANLTLSVILARAIGLYGVAIGTLIPSLFIQIVLWPRYICSLVNIELRNHLWQSWFRPFLAAVPFGVACALADRYWPASHLVSFFLQIAAMLPVYAVTVALCFRKEIMEQLRARKKWGARSESSSLS